MGQCRDSFPLTFRASYCTVIMLGGGFDYQMALFAESSFRPPSMPTLFKLPRITVLYHTCVIPNPLPISRQEPLKGCKHYP